MGDSVKLMLHYDDADVTYELQGKNRDVGVGDVFQIFDQNPYRSNPMVEVQHVDADGVFHAIPFHYFQVTAEQIEVVKK